MIDFIIPVQNAMLKPSDAQKAKIAEFIQGKETVRVVFSKPKTGRSVKANAFYWGVVLPMMARETGHTPEELHEFCKMEFLPRNFMTIAGLERAVRKSTTGLSVGEFAQYIDQVVAFAGRELRLAIPLPGE